MDTSYLYALKNCALCEWKCNVDRLNGERGVCRVGLPEIAYTSFAQVLKSYSITFLDVAFGAYTAMHTASHNTRCRLALSGISEPENVATEVRRALDTKTAQEIGIHRLSFTGGEASIHILSRGSSR